MAGGSARRLAAGLAAVSLLVLASAAPASAELRKLELQDGVLSIQAGQDDDVLEVVATKKAVTIVDRDPIKAKPAVCEGGYPDTATLVTCPRKAVKRVKADLGDGDDEFDGDGKLRFSVVGEKGNDRIDGGEARDKLEGKLGNDYLEGSEGSDLLLGGLGNDKLFGKAGRDVLEGGPGKDKGNGGPGKDRCRGIEKAKKGACR